jgi:hypothetical protein
LSLSRAVIALPSLSLEATLNNRECDGARDAIHT